MKKLNPVSIIIILLFIFNPLLSQDLKQSKLMGHWKQEGYGRVANIDESGFQIFNLCKISCEPSIEMSWVEAKEEYTFTKINNNSFTLKTGINKYQFNRIEKMPDLCTNPNPALKNDPIHNFESLWETFNEQYCYFETRNIDWAATKEKYISRLTKESTDLELYIVFREMLEGMNDGHVGMYPSSEVRAAYADYKAAQNKTTTDKKKKRISVNIDKTLRGLRKYYVKKFKTYNVSMAGWGEINEDLAYVQLNGMVGWADYGISQLMPEKIFEKRYDKAQEKSLTPSIDEVNGVRTAMTKIMGDIKDSKAVILDLRFNGGGHDEVALEMLRYFTKESTEVFSKKAFLNPGFTSPNVVSIQPAKEVYKGKVFILTSHFTASAAEIFMMSSLKAIPDAVRIGSKTCGVFSDILEKSLPNGWAYGLSNEVYLSADGIDYEHKGIAPHHEIDYDERLFWFVYNFKDLSNGDAAVEKVLELTGRKNF